MRFAQGGETCNCTAGYDDMARPEESIFWVNHYMFQSAQYFRYKNGGRTAGDGGHTDFNSHKVLDEPKFRIYNFVHDTRPAVLLARRVNETQAANAPLATCLRRVFYGELGRASL